MGMGLRPQTIEHRHAQGVPRWCEQIRQIYGHPGTDKSFHRDWLPVN